MLEDLLKFRDKKLGQSIWANIFSSLCVVIGWGYFLYMGVLDPSGGINILWPLFGMSNQMLAGIALCLATVVIYKKHKKYCFVTLLPLLFITGNTSYAVWQKVFSSDLRFINTNAEATIVIGQYVISALALMFLAILYIVIIATAKQLSNQLSLNFIKKYF
jgi:carbon starvation protein